ncbi:MAG: hypothetical protein LBI85_09105 [Spirochaetaceae bacterium]|jgi:hypothetical protein|nr:hypothetical protein [Spirochaetaceae bacterium]
MPSRKQLEEFITSFNAIANEAVLMAERHLPLNTPELPGQPSSNDAKPDNAPESGVQGGPEGDDLDFGAFLDTIPDDLSVPEGDGIPEDLLSGFADEIERGRAGTDADIPPSDSADLDDNSFQVREFRLVYLKMVILMDG